MVVFVGEELLMSELEHFRVLVVDVVNVLIYHVDGLIIFFHYELRSLDLALLVEVWDDQDVFKGSLSHSLSKL